VHTEGGEATPNVSPYSLLVNVPRGIYNAMPKHTAELVLILALLAAGVFQVGTYLTDWAFKKLKAKYGPKRPEPPDVVWIVNHDIVEHRMEGPILKRLVIYAAAAGTPRTSRIDGPLYEMVNNALVKHTAREVVEDMLTEYAMSRQLGVNMTPDQARRCVRDYFQIELRQWPPAEGE
jgi:hypothetical protein